MEYFDLDGKPIPLLRLIRNQPEWAESQIRTIATLRAERDELRERYTASLEICKLRKGQRDEALCALGRSDKERTELRERCEALEADGRLLCQVLCESTIAAESAALEALAEARGLLGECLPYVDKQGRMYGQLAQGWDCKDLARRVRDARGEG